MKSISYRRRRASRRDETHFIAFYSLLLASPSLNSSSLQHIRGPVTVSHFGAPFSPIHQGTRWDVLPLEATGRSDALAAQTSDPDALTDRRGEGRKGQPVAMKTAATEPHAALVWLYCHLMAVSSSPPCGRVIVWVVNTLWLLRQTHNVTPTQKA